MNKENNLPENTLPENTLYKIMYMMTVTDKQELSKTSQYMDLRRIFVEYILEMNIRNYRYDRELNALLH
jgi:hypothetical protein